MTKLKTKLVRKVGSLFSRVDFIFGIFISDPHPLPSDRGKGRGGGFDLDNAGRGEVCRRIDQRVFAQVSRSYSRFFSTTLIPVSNNSCSEIALSAGSEVSQMVRIVDLAIPFDSLITNRPFFFFTSSSSSFRRSIQLSISLSSTLNA